MPSSNYFAPELFKFLAELAANNNREWFSANKSRYEEHVKGPMLAFIADFGPQLAGITGSLAADPRPVGGSMFRIFRDTRFSRDKSPYKTHVAAQFRHVGGKSDVHGPGLYLHLEPGNSMAGGGMWHPDAATLAQVRQRIVNEPAVWKLIRDSGISIQGDQLKGAPRGFDARHPYLDDLRRKDFFSMKGLSDRDACANDFMERFTQVCRQIAPLMEFLTQAAGLTW